MSTAALVLVCALSLLGRSADRLPPIVLLDTRPAGVSANAEGFVRRDPDAIYLLTSAPVFQAAMWAEKFRGACWDRESLSKIASIIVHEEWHLLHGADEREAYAAQLTALTMLGFGPHSGLHFSVKRSMQAALNGSGRSVQQARVNGR